MISADSGPGLGTIGRLLRVQRREPRLSPPPPLVGRRLHRENQHSPVGMIENQPIKVPERGVRWEEGIPMLYQRDLAVPLSTFLRRLGRDEIGAEIRGVQLRTLLRGLFAAHAAEANSKTIESALGKGLSYPSVQMRPLSTRRPGASILCSSSRARCTLETVYDCWSPELQHAGFCPGIGLDLRNQPSWQPT